MELCNEEMVGVRDAGRRLPGLIVELNDGRREKVVLTRKGKLVAVMLTVEEYENLLQGEYPVQP